MSGLSCKLLTILSLHQKIGHAFTYRKKVYKKCVSIESGDSSKRIIHHNNISQVDPVIEIWVKGTPLT